MHVTHTPYHRISNLINRIKYKEGWSFWIAPMGGGHYIQVMLPERDEHGNRWTGRKWYISNHMTDSEIVSTAFLAILTAEEHETREAFLFDGQPIFGPHKTLEALSRETETEHRAPVRGLGEPSFRRPPTQEANPESKQTITAPQFGV